MDCCAQLLPEPLSMCIAIDTFRADVLQRVGDRTYVYRSLTEHLDRKLFYLPYAEKDYSSQGEKLRVLLRCVMASKVTRIVYRAAYTDAVSVRVIEPLTLLMWRGGLYLVVRSHGKHAQYMLAVDRIQNVERTGQSFRYPKTADYSPESLTEGGFGLYQERDGKVTDVELIFAAVPWVQREVLERRWHKTQRSELLDDGRLKITFRVRTLKELRMWVRQWGEDVCVVRPEDLMCDSSK